MASRLLDSLINDTMDTFGGQESLTAKLNASANLDQLDGLTTLLQEIEMGQKERIFWILLFSLMVLVAAGGNIVVIYIVSTNKEMKSVTNYFLVNLSLADTMVSTLNVIFNFTSMLNSHWPFGSIYCKISNFIAILSISASVFTLTAISCDRYNAIIHPLRPRMSHIHAIAWILLIWSLSSLLALPNLIYSVVVEDRLVNENLATTCTMIWPDGRYPLSSYDHIYNIIILVVTYLVPILTMAILYYRVGKELWGCAAIGENAEKQARAIMAKKKVVKMMIVVVIIFALCWLPYHGFFVVNYYLPTIFQDGPLFYQRCYFIMYWLAMSNSMYNPIIIYFMNSKFRHEFKNVLCFICCCKAYVPPIKCDTSAAAANHHPNNHNNNHHQHQAAARLNSSAQFQQTTRRPPASGPMSPSLAATPNQHQPFSGGHSFDSQQLQGQPSTNGGPAEVIITRASHGGDDEGLQARVMVKSSSQSSGQTDERGHYREQEPFLKQTCAGDNNHDFDPNDLMQGGGGKLVDLTASSKAATTSGVVDHHNHHQHHHHHQQQQISTDDKVWI